MQRAKPYDISYDQSTGILTWFVHDSLYQINALNEYKMQRYEAFLADKSYYTDEYGNKSSHFTGPFEDYDFEPDWVDFAQQHTTEQYIVST